MSNSIRIEDIPTLARWTEVGVSDNDNALNGYINTLQKRISELVLVEDYLAPRGEEKPSEEYEAASSCCRVMAQILSDMKAIRREVKTARLVNGVAKK